MCNIVMKAFAIKRPDGSIIVFTIAYSKELSVSKFENVKLFTWKELYNSGYRVVSVNITEETE